MKKLFVLPLILSIILSLGGCADKGSDPSSGEIGNMNLTGLPIAKEKVTLKFVVNKRITNGNFGEMVFFKNLEEKTNIHIEWDEIPRSQYAQKKNILLASGDLPDAFFAKNSLEQSDVIRYASIGDFIPLNDLIEQYAPNLSKIFEEKPEFRRIATAPDGKIYSFPNAFDEGVNDFPENHFIYKPWLDKLGYSVPQTIDEFHEVLTAFKTQDPNGNGKADEIPFSFLFNDTSSGIGKLYGSFGIVDFQSHLAIKDGEVIYTPTRPEYREAIKYFHTYFKEGLFDEEGFTQDSKQFRSKGVGEDTILGSYMAWNDYDIPSKNPQDYIVIPPLAGRDGTRMWGEHTDTLSSSGFVITKANKHPEMTTRWVDEFYDKITSMESLLGPIGVNIKEVGDGTYDYIPTPEGMTYGEFRFKNAPGSEAPAALFDEDFGTLIPREPSLLRKIGYNQKYYRPYSAMKLYPKIYLTAPDLERVSNLNIDLKNYAERSAAKWLTEGGIEAEWDGYISRMKSMGLDEYVEIYQRTYDTHISN